MIVVISDDSKGNYGTALKEELLSTGERVVYFAADTLHVKPCTACASCSRKTFGHCIIPDDMQEIYPEIVACKKLVLVSPVIFGGVSFHIKKVMDRMSALGDPRYYIKNGEMVKGMRVQGLEYYMVGIGNQPSEAEESAFLFLQQENATIMNVKGRAFILDVDANPTEIENVAREIVYE